MKKPHITRKKSGKVFDYYSDGQKLTNKKIIERINALAIPPAWQDVSISFSPRSKVLATGRDEAGRSQAIYHPSFRKRQEKLKFDKTLRFAIGLPKLRKQIQNDLMRRRMDREKVLACIVKLMDEAYFRVGNEKYARENQSYGITTLRSKHTTVKGDTVTFEFIGKSGKEHVKQISDKQIAAIVRKLDELPGYEIFRWQDDNGQMHDIHSNDVNEYIKEHMGEEFSAKDFRTWGGTLLATSAILAEELHDNETQRKRSITNVVEQVSKKLGNTPAVARASYIDPRVIDAYMDGRNLTKVKRAMSNMRPKKYMSVEEQCVLRLLEA